ncbi:ligase-associated DNA damage response endonuclease PdeM [Winogradskyella sp. PE311]|uniref:ligase-associated DNA damage response endonuclease PdeM n=1 Tax=Winogradskyella sp. PE311 TaxID=3366943 RepID=UPI003980310B
MVIAEEHIIVEGENLILTNLRAIYWPNENAIVLSDLHIGKTGHFKKHGIPIPDAILQKDLERLEFLIHHYRAKKMLVVGDLFHAQYNEDMVTFKTWLLKFKGLKIILIKGNHDRLSKKIMTEFNFTTETELELHPFLFVHEPLESHNDKFTISGHIHPGIIISGKGKQKLKLPCYHINRNQIILPAFSLFTGLNTRQLLSDAVSYAFTESSIFKF